MEHDDNVKKTWRSVADTSWIVGLSKDAIFWTSVVYALLALVI